MLFIHSPVVFVVHYLYIYIYIYRDDHHKGKVSVPDTKVGEEGTAKRNIQRKNNPTIIDGAGAVKEHKKQHGGGGGKGKWNDLDDGTMPLPDE